MTIGIYLLRFKNTDKVYIGQSLNIEGRYKGHLYKFNKGIASNKLQQAFNTFGVPEIEILCECSEQELDKTEDEAIEIFDAVNNGFNTLKSSLDSHTCSRYGELNSCSKHTNDQIMHAFLLLVNSPEMYYTDITEKTGVSGGVLSNISSLTGHVWLKEVFPVEYTTLIKQKGTRAKSKYYDEQGMVLKNRVICSAKHQGIEYPRIVNTAGEVFEVENVHQFAKQHNLERSCLSRLLNKKAKTHKGWKILQ